MPSVAQREFMEVIKTIRELRERLLRESQVACDSDSVFCCSLYGSSSWRYASCDSALLRDW